MAKKRSALSRREKLVRKNASDIRAYAKTSEYKAEIARLKSMPDSAIDFSDIPELTEEQLARLVRARLKPRKTPVSIRVDSDVLHWLKLQGGAGYQTRINRLLRKAMTNANSRRKASLQKT